MENYLNNLLLTYLPYVAIAVFLFGVITRSIKLQKTIVARSTQFLGEKKSLMWGSNLFHVGIILVFFGHIFGLFTPAKFYHLFVTTQTKQILAVSMGSLFGLIAFIGLITLCIRRVSNSKIRLNSRPQDYILLILLFLEILIGLICVTKTSQSTPAEYAAFGIWAQKIITFQPDSYMVLLHHSFLYKIHIVLGLLIFIIFPYTKLMHMIVVPISYVLRSTYQLVRIRITNIKH